MAIIRHLAAQYCAAVSQRCGNVLGCSEHLHTALQPQQKLMTLW